MTSLTSSSIAAGTDDAEARAQRGVVVRRDIQAWESDGGAMGCTRSEAPVMANEAAWAQQIKARVCADFDRVVNALKSAAETLTGDRQIDALMVISILEEIRAEVMAKDQPGYFIVEWQDASDQVRRIVANDRSYKDGIAGQTISPGSSNGQLR